MEIRDVDRLILVMLAEIQENLKIKGEIDTAFLKDAIFGGHDWALEWRMPGIFKVEQTSRDVLAETVDVLDMYDMMERSYDDLGPSEKVGFDRHEVEFHGFDGNHETDHMGVAQFLVEKMNRFPRFLGRTFNSHHPTLDRVRRMLRAYEPLRAGTGQRSGVPRLNADEIRQVLAAGRL
ncbi:MULTISPECIES: YfbU family protein [Brevundimonas]|uniref:YfbU family protein n=1 Tax=Brevundimonas TaxID=41275 RepID=UPI00069AA93B|nr:MULTISPECIES: YfbU family protein [Brevundimonas]